MTSITKTVETTLRHLGVDLQHAARMISWADQIIAHNHPRTAPIPMASTGLATAALLGTGTSALVSYGAGKAARCFSQQINPNYVIMFGIILFIGWVLSKLSNWATWQFKDLSQLQQLALRQQIPYFITKRGPALGLRYSFKNNFDEQARDYLYSKLYVIYGIVSNGKPAPKSLPELQHRLEQAAALLERHLPHDLSRDGEEIFFRHFNAHGRAALIEEAKNELRSDLMVSLNLKPAKSEMPPFMKKKGAPLKLVAAKNPIPSPEFPLRMYQGLYLLNYQKQVPDFLYRRLYAMYEIVGNGKPAQSYLEFRNRMTKAVELLDRHLSHDLTEDERIIFFEHLDESSRARLIEEAKIQLFFDMSQHLQLTPAYEEIVRRATAKEKIALEKKMYSLPNIEENIQDLLKAVEKGDWDDDIFQKKWPISSQLEFPYYALEAVRRGQLSPHDYATVQIFWEITQMHPDASTRKTIPIFNPDGTVNKEAKEYILKTLVLDKKIKNPSCFFSAEQIDQLFEKIKKLPKIQQQIWIVPHVREPIMEEIFTPILAQVSNAKMMMPSLGVMQALLDTAFGENAVQLNPVHGLSSWGDIRQNHVDGKRDYAIHSPVIELVEEADGFKARWFYFGKHDFYHALVISSVPKVLRQCYVECYDIIQRPLETPNPDKGSRFIDMDATQFLAYFDSNKESLNDVFWSELADFIMASVDSEKIMEQIEQKKKPVKPPQAELDSLAMLYAEQIASHLSSIPEIQEGARAVAQKIKERKYSYGPTSDYSFDKPNIFDALSNIWWPNLDLFGA